MHNDNGQNNGQNNEEGSSPYTFGILSRFVQPTDPTAAIIATLHNVDHNTDQEVTLSGYAMGELFAAAVARHYSTGNELTEPQKKDLDRALRTAVLANDTALGNIEARHPVAQAVRRLFFAVGVSGEPYAGLVHLASHPRPPARQHVAAFTLATAVRSHTVMVGMLALRFSCPAGAEPILEAMLNVPHGCPAVVRLSLSAIRRLVGAEVARRGESSLTPQQMWYVKILDVMFGLLDGLPDGLAYDSRAPIVMNFAVEALMAVTGSFSSHAGVFELQDPRATAAGYASWRVADYEPLSEVGKKT